MRNILTGRRSSRVSLLAAVSCAFLLSLPACKPTEKNYRMAYDAALAKRQAKVDADLGVPEEGLIVEGEPARRTIGDIEVWYLVSPLGMVGEGSLPPGAFNVATGGFKMPVNALDQARVLRGQGYDAFAARGENELFYTVVFAADSLPEAVAFYKEFQKGNPDFTYVGLPYLTIVEKR